MYPFTLAVVSLVAGFLKQAAAVKCFDGFALDDSAFPVKRYKTKDCSGFCIYSYAQSARNDRVVMVHCDEERQCRSDRQGFSENKPNYDGTLHGYCCNKDYCNDGNYAKAGSGVQVRPVVTQGLTCYEGAIEYDANLEVVYQGVQETACDGGGSTASGCYAGVVYDQDGVIYEIGGCLFGGTCPSFGATASVKLESLNVAGKGSFHWSKPQNINVLCCSTDLCNNDDLAKQAPKNEGGGGRLTPDDGGNKPSGGNAPGSPNVVSPFLTALSLVLLSMFV